MTEDEIKAFVAERVAKVKRITGGVVFMDAIPKNPVCCAIVDLVAYSHSSSQARFSANSSANELQQRCGQIRRGLPCCEDTQ